MRLEAKKTRKHKSRPPLRLQRKKGKTVRLSHLFTVMNELMFFFSSLLWQFFLQIISIWIMLFMCNDNFLHSSLAAFGCLYNCATLPFFIHLGDVSACVCVVFFFFSKFMHSTGVVSFLCCHVLSFFSLLLSPLSSDARTVCWKIY